jgi:hypothetical protein
MGGLVDGLLRLTKVHLITDLLLLRGPFDSPFPSDRRPRSDSFHEGTQDPLHHLHLPPTSKLLGRGSRQGRVTSALPLTTWRIRKAGGEALADPVRCIGEGSTARAELLHVLMLPDFDRADRIGEFWGNPKTRTFAELLIDCEEDRTAMGGAGRHVAGG